MTNFFISDTHFGHANVIKFDNRPFKGTEDMWQTIRDNWNRTVGAGDTVYVLGDFCWEKEQNWPKYLSELSGQKVLLRGNHDPKKFSAAVSRMFVDIKDYKEIDDNGRKVILCHYPIPFHKRGYDPNVFMLYGHVHNTREAVLMNELREKIRATCTEGSHRSVGNWYNCCCSAPWMGYTPRTLDEIVDGDAKASAWQYDADRTC